jgi:MGT family glycosyltransferase
MSKVLMVTWDGAGNLVSTLGVARALAERGHDVRLLGHRSIDQRCGAHGWRFRPFRHTVEFDSTAVLDPAAEMEVLTRDLWFNDSVARDVVDELEQEGADLLVVDCLLPGGLSAGVAAGVPTAALFHSPISGFLGGPMVEMMMPAMPAVNAGRADLGLGAIDWLAELYAECDLAIVATPREFEVEQPFPANVHFVGPVLGGPPLTADLDETTTDDGPAPLVVVSLSTSHQGQVPVLQLLIDALAELPVRVVVTTGPAVSRDDVTARANTTVAGYVPHTSLLPQASLVVTHAGLETVMATLSHGVPLLCVPMGRDQFFNASRVQDLGAGQVISADADTSTIVAAVESLLGPDSTARDGAKHFAQVIAGYGGADAAVDALEDLARRTLAR